jgi:hypothetical protein
LKVAVPWFRAEDYDRIREISGDNMLPTFAEWEAKMTRTLAQSAAAGVRGEKVIIRPDELVAFAKQMEPGACQPGSSTSSTTDSWATVSDRDEAA